MILVERQYWLNDFWHNEKQPRFKLILAMLAQLRENRSIVLGSILVRLSNQVRCILFHRFHALFLGERLPSLGIFAKEFEIVAIEGWCECVEELRRLVGHVCEAMRCSWWDHDIVPSRSIDIAFSWNLKLESAFGNKEGLVVHEMKVWCRSRGVCRYRKCCSADTVIY